MLSKLVVAENRGSRAEGKAKEYWAKFHTLEKKPQVEQDLRAFRSKLCESNLSARVCPGFCSRPIRRSVMNEDELYDRYLAAQLACQKLAHHLYTDPQVQAKYPQIELFHAHTGCNNPRGTTSSHRYSCVLEQLKLNSRFFELYTLEEHRQKLKWNRCGHLVSRRAGPRIGQ